MINPGQVLVVIALEILIFGVVIGEAFWRIAYALERIAEKAGR